MKKIITTLITLLVIGQNIFGGTFAFPPFTSFSEDFVEFTSTAKTNDDKTGSSFNNVILESLFQQIEDVKILVKTYDKLQKVRGKEGHAHAQKLSELQKMMTATIESFSDAEAAYYNIERFKRDTEARKRFPLTWKHFWSNAHIQKLHDKFIQDPYSELKNPDADDELEDMGIQLLEFALRELLSAIDVLNGEQQAELIMLILQQVASTNNPFSSNLYLMLNYLEREPGKKEQYPSTYHFLTKYSIVKKLIADYQQDPYNFMSDDEDLTNYFK